MEKSIIKKRILKGVVVSDKMQKTVVVEVKRLKMHAKYKKYFKMSSKFKAHNPDDSFHTGDNILIQETNPMSKDKRWIVIGKIESGKEKQN